VGTIVGDRAPDFTLPDVHGRPVRLSQFRGRGVIIHFWAVACTTCQGEQAGYVRAIVALGRSAPQVLAVDAWRESSGMIAAYMQREHLPGIGLVDLTASVVEGIYGVQGTPTTYFIDRHGIIRRVVAGPETSTQIVSNARSIMA
jgi:peroxiredoxin